jgi:hypothetical protein
MFSGSRDDSDPLFLQVERGPRESVPSRFMGAGKYANQGSGWSAGL